jgi:transcriptional regulator with XRE-family HTH domain
MITLPEQLHQVIARITAARHRAGLSQRALGDKVGLAQSHVSKIERSAVDPQVSSLLEIARALGLEVMLVPTKLVPAVQALQREADPDPRRLPLAIDRDLLRLARNARKLLTWFPGLQVLAELSTAADELRIARLDESLVDEARSAIDAAEPILKRLRAHARNQGVAELSAVVAIAAQALTPIARLMRNLRNAWIQRDSSSIQTPAYRLDDPDA